MSCDVIAIPSYRRPSGVLDKTLAFLAPYRGYAPIVILVADNDERRAYLEAGVNEKMLRVTAPGLAASRQAFLDGLPDGTRVFWLDDDVLDIRIRVDEKRLVSGDLREIVAHGFDAADDASATLWGIYPAANPYFMRPANTVRVGLLYIAGGYYGQIVRANPGYRIRHGDAKEDYERSLRHWQVDGRVVRLEWVTGKTTYFLAHGGMAAARSVDGWVEAGVRALVDEFGADVVRVRRKKTSRFPEILLRDPARREVWT